jgi:hypothetical protein
MVYSEISIENFGQPGALRQLEKRVLTKTAARRKTAIFFPIFMMNTLCLRLLKMVLNYLISDFPGGTTTASAASCCRQGNQ